MAPVTYNIDQLDNAAFEHAIADLFRRLGFYVEVSTRSGGIVAKRTGEIIFVDCKNNKRALGKSAIQIFHSTVSTYSAGARGLVAEISQFFNSNNTAAGVSSPRPSSTRSHQPLAAGSRYSNESAERSRR